MKKASPRSIDPGGRLATILAATRRPQGSREPYAPLCYKQNDRRQLICSSVKEAQTGPLKHPKAVRVSRLREQRENSSRPRRGRQMPKERKGGAGPKRERAPPRFAPADEARQCATQTAGTCARSIYQQAPAQPPPLGAPRGAGEAPPAPRGARPPSTKTPKKWPQEEESCGGEGGKPNRRGKRAATKRRQQSEQIDGLRLRSHSPCPGDKPAGLLPQACAARKQQRTS